MGALENILGELAAAKQGAIDSQFFTYRFSTFVPNFALHNASAFQGNLLATPGLGKIRVRCEDDAHMRITNITMSCFGPVPYNAALAPDDPAQTRLLSKKGATMFPMPGSLQPMPTASCAVTAVNTGTDTLTLTPGFTPRVGHPIMFYAAPVTSALPGGLSQSTLYFIGTVAGNDITVFDENGNTVDITSAGTAPFSALLCPTVAASGIAAVPMLFTEKTGLSLSPLGQPVILLAYGAAVLPLVETGVLVSGDTYYKIPVTVNTFYLARSPAAALAGTTINVNAGADHGSGTFYAVSGSARAERGLAVCISDLSKVSRVLTSDGLFPAFVPVETLFAPCYGTNNPGSLRTLEGYVLPKQHELLFQFKNRDTMGFLAGGANADNQAWLDFGHVVSVALTGEKFYD